MVKKRRTETNGTTEKKRRRLNICGLLEKGKKFDYGLALKNFQGESYRKLMDWQAEQAAKRLAQKGQITVIVEDRASIHIAKKIEKKFENGNRKDYIYFSCQVIPQNLMKLKMSGKG